MKKIIQYSLLMLLYIAAFAYPAYKFLVGFSDHYPQLALIVKSFRGIGIMSMCISVLLIIFCLLFLFFNKYIRWLFMPLLLAVFIYVIHYNSKNFTFHDKIRPNSLHTFAASKGKKKEFLALLYYMHDNYKGKIFITYSNEIIPRLSEDIGRIDVIVNNNYKTELTPEQVEIISYMPCMKYEAENKNTYVFVDDTLLSTLSENFYLMNFDKSIYVVPEVFFNQFNENKK